jgi:hypothetical protein
MLVAAGQSLLYRPKLLYPSAPIGLSHIDVALRIDGERVGVGKLADLMARATEAREDFATGTIENLHLLVATIGHVDVFLFSVRRKFDPPSGSPRIWKAALSLDPDILSKVPLFIEYLNAITLPVANVYEAVVAKGYAVHHLHKRTANTRVGLLFGALMPPLPQSPTHKDLITFKSLRSAS